MGTQHFDVIIIGAGLSGIGSACHISKECPNKSLAILERRDTMGGTWDLFRYPGIRSDSDMTSFGFQFKPWFSDTVLAKGPDIRDYVLETAEEFKLKEKTHFGLKITKANWSTVKQCWQITALHEASGEEKHFTSSFFLNCTGYYNYDQGYQPKFGGEEDYNGQVIHPQHWPEDLDYSGKKVVVIGSGATAVTIVPSMSGTAEHVTMLQRSPTYVMPLPDTDKIAMFMNKFLPKSWVFQITRKRNIWIQRALYLACMKWPDAMRNFLLKRIKKEVGPNFDMKHLTPSYKPWEERLCAAPDGDFFESLRNGKSSIVTDHIERFTKKGLLLKSGKELEADIVVTATGLEMQMLGGLELSIDEKPTNIADQMTYKSAMIENIPNFSWVFGYTNAPWTLKCDIASRYICRLIKYMDEHKYKVATPVDTNHQQVAAGITDEFSPGYIQRAKKLLPRQGKSGPWKLEMHYGKDRKVLLQGEVNDGIMKFEHAHEAAELVDTPQVRLAS
jgi:cation diffusion facilitator CzcD-associated flavoprotein CzcO